MGQIGPIEYTTDAADGTRQKHRKEKKSEIKKKGGKKKKKRPQHPRTSPNTDRTRLMTCDFG